MKPLKLLFALVLAFCFGISAHAQLLDFDFSFTSDGTPEGYPFGSPVQGTVTGELIGIYNNDSNSPIQTISYPEAIIYSSPLVGLTTPVQLQCWNGYFMVTNGEITDYPDFSAEIYNPNGEDALLTLGQSNSLYYSPNGFNFDGYTPGAIQVSNSEGAAGVTFTYAGIAAPTPELSTWALMLSGLGLLIFIHILRIRRIYLGPTMGS